MPRLFLAGHERERLDPDERIAQTIQLILTGVAGNICILFSANDAYMRDFNVVVPADCVASNTKEENDHALEQIRIVLKGDITKSTELDLIKLLGSATSREREG